MAAEQLFIGRLPRSTRTRELEDIFYKYGRMTRCDVKQGLKMSYGFIEYEDMRDAEDAIHNEHGREMGGSRIVVEWARGPKYDYRQDYERHKRERDNRGSRDQRRRSRSRSRDRRHRSRSRSHDRRKSRSRSRDRPDRPDRRSRSRSHDRSRGKERSRSKSQDRDDRKSRSGSRDRRSQDRDERAGRSGSRERGHGNKRSHSRSRDRSPSGSPKNDRGSSPCRSPDHRGGGDSLALDKENGQEASPGKCPASAGED